MKVKIINVLSNKFSLNDRKKEVASTSGEKDLNLLHSPLYFNRNINEGEYLSSLNNSEEGKILNLKTPHPSPLISLEGQSEEKNMQ